MNEIKLTDKQYALLLDLYHEFNLAFYSLDPAIRSAYFKRLYQGK
jgi:hypothetical protein